MDLKTFCSEHAGGVETAGRALGPLAAAPLVPPWSPPGLWSQEHDRVNEFSRPCDFCGSKPN